MILSLALILGLGFLVGFLFKKMYLPPLIGMIIVGVVIGPHELSLIDSSVLDISSELRSIALIIILTRAGLKLKTTDLKQIGRSAILMSFLPATFEIIAITLLAPVLFPNLNYTSAALMGTVLAAVSPAVIVPTMLKIIRERYGENKKVPHLVLAGASVDDIYTIIIFYTLLSFLTNNSIDAWTIIKAPLSIFIGVFLGILVGWIFGLFFNKFNILTIFKVILMIVFSFTVFGIEKEWGYWVPISSLLSIISMSIALQKTSKKGVVDIEKSYSNMWVIGEIILFTLVGATVNLSSLESNWWMLIILITIALLARGIGVLLSLIKTGLNIKEKIFCLISYIPKATVQAAIGSIALSAGLSSGQLVLSAAVISILFTAPLGALLIEFLYKKLLAKDNIIEEFNNNQSPPSEIKNFNMQTTVKKEL
ncbi:sodium:proton antiporter [Mycoplasma sp. Mirounga ES2805-ORL]|uniref:cation:proton antiporter n=1 Tax=Mycoplasma sp. Mirounga ES2805-ORL TaxID=754514 RepID=UPI00197C8D86|nr:cation:proton antiporter [Mycoplasma sp. Mirounga ES2805-ORL]QSF13460.1 cation:proton antiporter [Mycoplasma sp. Mirounga ES2805-ORL]